MNLYIVPAWYPQHEQDITASFFREQAQALAERGHRVTVIHIEPVSVSKVLAKPWHETNVWQDGEVRTVFHKVIVPIPGKLSGPQDAYISKLFYKILKKQIREDVKEGLPAPDLLHAHVSHSCAYYCLKAAKDLKLPLVVTEHYSGLLLGTASEKEYRRVKATIEQSDAYVFVGSCFQQTVCKRLGVNKQTQVISNMLDVDLYSAELTTDKTDYTFLTACHLKTHKSVDKVIRAFHKAFEKEHNVRLVVAGDGEEAENLRILARELQEESRITFFGRYSREQAKTLFSGADAFVLTSKVEPFGIVYIEALASGVPCIGTKGQGADDILTETNGFTVSYGDEEALVSAMQTLYAQREGYDRKALREDCVKRFGKDAICEQIEAVYEAVKKA